MPVFHQSVIVGPLSREQLSCLSRHSIDTGHHDQCIVWICCLLIAFTEASCPWEGKQICEGAVTNELSTLVKICVDGKLKLKKKSDIAPGWPKAGGGIIVMSIISVFIIPCSL